MHGPNEAWNGLDSERPGSTVVGNEGGQPIMVIASGNPEMLWAM